MQTENVSIEESGALLSTVKSNVHPFRLGIELETGILLPELVTKYHKFQKTPLFYCCNGQGKKLWHVEIDGLDIEFVTMPFSHLNEVELGECSSSLQEAACILLSLVNSENEITFSQWLQVLKSKIQNLEWHSNELFHCLENEIIQWKEGYQNWDGLLQPHATIQLPLQRVVDLVFDLFAEDQSIISILEGALPFRTMEDCDAYFKVDAKVRSRKQFQNKLDGLMFLQALTFLDLTLPAFAHDETELAERLVHDDIYCQEICPKMYLHVMSRRPFSDMWQQLESNQSGYADLFKERMKNNMLFSSLSTLNDYYNGRKVSRSDKTDGVPDNFWKVSYGQEYYWGENEESQDLTSILKPDYFKKGEISEESLEYYLKNGIISTSMLRTLKSDIASALHLDNLREIMSYDFVVASIEKPKWRPTIKIEDQQITVTWDNSDQSEIVPHDFLSPPLFMSQYTLGIDKRNCDSMGSFQQTPEELEISIYGEAILEIRAIGFAHNEYLGGRMVRNGELIPNLFLSEPEYLDSDFRSLYRYIKRYFEL